VYESFARCLAISRGVQLEKVSIFLGGNTWSNATRRRKTGQFLNWFLWNKLSACRCTAPSWKSTRNITTCLLRKTTLHIPFAFSYAKPTLRLVVRSLHLIFYGDTGPHSLFVFSSYECYDNGLLSPSYHVSLGVFRK